MTAGAALRAFGGAGIELEYMLVGRDTLDVAPVADRVLRELSGQPEACDLDRGVLGWSNELVTHVLELKNQRPAADLPALARAFAREVCWMDERLATFGLRLMPTAMHPWMDPATQTRIWPIDPQGIYRRYDELFDCRRHGWANLQSMHLNLPFGGDTEFARLHAAIRLLLPVLPALAASSPWAEGRFTGLLDFRLRTYRDNAASMPSIAGRVVPEAVTSEADYRARILAPMYAEIAPHDPRGALRHEWLNSRGAIARFDRSAIEIRVLDVQECTSADVAIAGLVTDVLRALHDGRLGDVDTPLETDALAAVLDDCSVDAERTRLDDRAWLAALGWTHGPCEAGDLWRFLRERTGGSGTTAVDTVSVDGTNGIVEAPSERTGRPRAADTGDAALRTRGGRLDAALDLILDEGPLARRLLTAAGSDPSPGVLRELAARLCDGLARDEGFRAA